MFVISTNHTLFRHTHGEMHVQTKKISKKKKKKNEKNILGFATAVP